MSITKIEYEKEIWEFRVNEKGERVSTRKTPELKTVTREEYSGDFDRLILDEMSDYEIEQYAEYRLGMIQEDDCDCDSSLDDFSTSSIIYELEERGYKVIPCQTIADDLKLQKLKEIMEIQ